MSDGFLVVAVLAASAVEMVEALTIVLAAGVTRGWRSTLEGAVAALVALAALVAAFGPTLVSAVPIDTLRVVIGVLLLIFGLQWLRKAILRSAGLKALHDEDAVYAAEVARLSAEPRPAGGRDATGFVVAFKGVFLEGLEVVVIVISLGLPSHRLALAVLGATLAVMGVALAGLVVHRQLSRVPENTLKMGVGLLLVSFGTFWTGEGSKLVWPGADAFILVLLAFYAATTVLLVRVVGRVPVLAEHGGPA